MMKVLLPFLVGSAWAILFLLNEYYLGDRLIVQYVVRIALFTIVPLLCGLFLMRAGVPVPLVSLVLPIIPSVVWVLHNSLYFGLLRFFDILLLGSVSAIVMEIGVLSRQKIGTLRYAFTLTAGILLLAASLHLFGPKFGKGYSGVFNYEFEGDSFRSVLDYASPYGDELHAAVDSMVARDKDMKELYRKNGKLTFEVAMVADRSSIGLHGTFGLYPLRPPF